MLYVKTHRYDPEKDTDPRALVELGIPIEFEGGSFWRDMSDPLFVAHRQGALDLWADWRAQKYQTEIVVNRRVADVLRPPLMADWLLREGDVFRVSQNALDEATSAFTDAGWTMEWSRQVPEEMIKKEAAELWAPYVKTDKGRKVFQIQGYCLDLRNHWLRDASVRDIAETLDAYRADAWSTAAKLGWWARRPSWGPARPIRYNDGADKYPRGYSHDGPLVCSTKWENPYRTGEFEWCLRDIIRRVYAQTGKPCILHELKNENLPHWPLDAGLLTRGMVRVGW